MKLLKLLLAPILIPLAIWRCLTRSLLEATIEAGPAIDAPCRVRRLATDIVGWCHDHPPKDRTPFHLYVIRYMLRAGFTPEEIAMSGNHVWTQTWARNVVKGRSRDTR